jgi:hypothetical protein
MNWWDRFLDWVAEAYYWVYVKLLQRPPSEPITRQASRIEERWPAMAWGVALIIFVLTAQLRGWGVLLTAAVYLFAWWWCPHVVRYRVAHPENKPYLLRWQEKALNWATDRRENARIRMELSK